MSRPEPGERTFERMTASVRRSVVADPTRSTAWTDHAATSRGYRAHLKRGEPACTACKKAEASAAAERKLRRAS